MVKGYNVHNETYKLTPATAMVIDNDQYTELDVIGGLLTFTLSINREIKGFVVLNASVRSNSIQKAAMKLYLFEQQPTAIVDDASFNTIAAASLDFMPAGSNGITINAGDWITYTTTDEGTIEIAAMPNINLKLDIKNGTPSTIYGYLVCSATPTFTATDDLQVSLEVWVD